MKIKRTIPTLSRMSLCRLKPGLFSARELNPPSGDDCAYLLVRADGSLGWADKNGASVSRFTVDDLMDE